VVPVPRAQRIRHRCRRCHSVLEEREPRRADGLCYRCRRPYDPSGIINSK
ncbi:hypothetical protein NPIL_388811, partial [Nephila pilipes]